MSTLTRHREDIVHLYLVGKMNLRHIGARFGVTHEAIRQELLAAGVELRSRGAGVALKAARTEKAARAAAERPKPALPPGPKPQVSLAFEDAQHVNDVIRANGGRGFPFMRDGGL
jgi:hypothetical protein